jgi:hypothetical protein
MKMGKQLNEGLRRVADLVVPDHVRATERLQKAVWAYEPVERVPVVMFWVDPPEWPLYPYNEIFEDPEKMLWNELLQTYVGVSLRDDRVLNVRANYGPAIVPSLFGAKVDVDENTTWVEGCHSSRAIREIVDRGVPDLTTGLGARVFETEALYRDCLRDWGLDPYVHMFQADNQSPFDCAHLLWGIEIFAALYDEPDLVHALLNLITETTILLVRRQKEILGEDQDWMYHWWYRVPAGVRVVDDTTLTLSPKMYAEFARPYIERIFAAFGSGYMHYCGHALHAQHLRLATKGLRGIEMNQEIAEDRNPAFKFEEICRQAAEHRVTLCWIGTRLPAERPVDIKTGLVFGQVDRSPLEHARGRLAVAQAFWCNERLASTTPTT